MFLVDSLVAFADDAIVVERLKEEVKWVFRFEEDKGWKKLFLRKLRI